MSKSVLTKLPQSLVRLDIQIELAESEELWQKAEQRIASTADLDGFRPGKAPLEIVRQKISPKVFFDEFLNLVLPRTFSRAVLENNLETIGEPQVELKTEAINNEGFSYSATVAVVPEVVLPEVEQLEKIKREEVVVKDEEIAEAINELRELRAREVAVSRPAQANDLARLDVSIKKEGVVVEGGEVLNYPCLVSKKQILAEIDEALVGMKDGEKKIVAVKFPADYKNKNLAGVEAQAEVTLRQVFERLLPEVTDEFVQGLGDFKDVADLKTRLKENIFHEREHQVQQTLENKVFDLLLEKSQVGEVPETSVALETDRIVSEIKEDLSHQQATWENYLGHLGLSEEKYRENLKSSAEKRAKLGFVLRALAKKWTLEVEPEDVSAMSEKMSAKLSAGEEIDGVAIKNYLLYQKTVKKVLTMLVDGPAFLDHEH